MRETEILDDPNTSQWLRDALRSALGCDAVRVANDVEILRQILHERLAGDAPRHSDASARFPEAWIPAKV